MDAKKFLVEVLDFYKYKIENDKCTSDDMRTAFELISKGAVCDATIKDMAEFYGQSESNIRNVVSRKLFDKPKRCVLYNFAKIAKIIPKKWVRGGV